MTRRSERMARYQGSLATTAITESAAGPLLAGVLAIWRSMLQTFICLIGKNKQEPDLMAGIFSSTMILSITPFSIKMNKT
jgi:hypothetical protein